MKGDPVGLIVEHHTGHHQQLGKMHHVNPVLLVPVELDACRREIRGGGGGGEEEEDGGGVAW